MHAPYTASAEPVVRDCRFASRSDHLTDARFDAAGFVLLGNADAGRGATSRTPGKCNNRIRTRRSLSVPESCMQR